jgi:hypothetical protein
MKHQKQRVYILPLFINLIKEMAITAFKIFIVCIVIWVLIKGMVNGMEVVK